MILGLTIAGLLVAFGVGAGLRQFRTLRRVRDEPYMPEEDKRYFRSQARRRLLASGLLITIGGMIAGYYLSGMDARMDEIPERNKPGGQPAPDDPQAEADKQFVKFVGGYWIVVVVLLGVVVGVALIDFWATRKYWMARYREMKQDYDAKLQRDLAVYRQQRLNERARGLRKPEDETPPDGNEPLPE